MKKFYTLCMILCGILFSKDLKSQAFTIDNNHSLHGLPINGKLILISDRDSLLYSSTGSTVAAPYATVKAASDGAAILNNKLYFPGIDASGDELWVTDGTTSGTSLVADIAPGSDSSFPKDFATFNSKIYFTATTVANGREMYSYSGSGSPTRITDLNPNAGDGFSNPQYYVNNGLLYFDAFNGTVTSLYVMNASSVITKIFDFPANYSLHSYSELGNTVYFILTGSLYDFNIYKSNGTAPGTSLVHSFPAMYSSSFAQMVPFNNKLFFAAAASLGDYELWSTDGATTALVKDIEPGTTGSNPLLFNSVILNGRLVFQATTTADGSELWVTDGTNAGTQQLININTASGQGSDPYLMPVFNYEFSSLNDYNFGFTRSSNYNGYIFFTANDGVNGVELWKTNGIVGGTSMVKNINPSGDGVYSGPYLYSSSGLLFAGDDGSGNDPWISDGTSSGTKAVANLNSSGNSNPEYEFLWNGDVYVSATNGDDATYTDYFKLTGPYGSLPVSLSSFTAEARESQVILNWTTSSESNSDHFEVQRSTNGNDFNAIANVAAAGNSSTLHAYSYNDIDAANLSVNELYYRLNLVDKDGKSAMSKIARVHLNDAKLKVQLYPNPAHNQLNINYSSPAATIQLRITDLNGKQILKTELPAAANGLKQLDISSFATGTYFVQLQNGNVIKTEKFVKK